MGQDLFAGLGQDLAEGSHTPRRRENKRKWGLKIKPFYAVFAPFSLTLPDQLYFSPTPIADRPVAKRGGIGT